jgi:flagellar basal-body rod protein FlgG
MRLRCSSFPAFQLKEIFMFPALYVAAGGMTAQQLNLDNIANNLANISTVGFRQRRIQFEDLVYQNLVVPGSAATQQTTMPTGLQIGLGARTAASEILQTQGEYTNTGNPLDLTIQGQGFFQVLLPTGQIAYTRAGAFQLNEQRNIVTADGNPLDPPITIPSDALTISIGTDGTVSVTEPGSQQAQQVGTIQLALFPNPAGLESIGQNLFIPTTSSGAPITGTPGGNEGLGTVQQGMLEQSNVNVVDQFVAMIETQRAYEANSRVVQSADQMLQQLNQLAP